MFAIICVLLIVACINTGILNVDAEGCTQNRDGCKIDGDRCICGYGCYTDYRFSTKGECQKALRSKEWDICQRNPCRHGGACSQISLEPGYKCRCEGTGFHGQRCHRPCPRVGDRIQEFPSECIDI